MINKKINVKIIYLIYKKNIKIYKKRRNKKNILSSYVDKLWNLEKK